MSYILLGDSVLDNITYIEQNENSVQKWIEELTGELVFRAATDGDVAEDVFSQLEKPVPKEFQPIEHVVLSVGGNDLLTFLSEAEDNNWGFSETVSNLYELSIWFSTTYRDLLKEIQTLYKKANINVCTIYKGSPDSYLFKLGEMLLPVFNRTIVEVSKELGCRIIDLNEEFSDPEYYTSIIEPSNKGGEYIAKLIVGEL